MKQTKQLLVFLAVLMLGAYGFPVSRDFTESDCVARLFEMTSS